MHVMEDCKTIFDPRYSRLIADLVKIRNSRGLTQRAFAKKSGYNLSFIAKTELRERRLDFIETINYMRHLGLTQDEVKAKLAEWADAFVR